MVVARVLASAAARRRYRRTAFAGTTARSGSRTLSAIAVSFSVRAIRAVVADTACSAIATGYTSAAGRARSAAPVAAVAA